MAKREWTPMDEEMEREGSFITLSRTQVLDRPKGKRGMLAQRGRDRGETKIANLVVGRVERG